VSGRTIAVLALLLIVWACFAFAVTAWLQSEQQRCLKFGDLYAECLAPQMLIATLLSVVFVVASAAGVWLALRR